MKTICCFMLISCMICSMIAIPIGANNVSSITEPEARELMFNSLNLFHNVHWAMDSVHFDSRTPLIQIDGEWYFELYEEHLPGGSYSAMKEYAKSIYTDDIVKNMYEHSRSIYPKPMFAISQDGKLCIYPPYGQIGTFIYWGANSRDWSHYREEHMTIKLTDCNSKSAVVLLKIQYGSEVQSDYYWIECKLVNTDNGWRIAESPFTHMLEWGASGYSLWKDGLVPYEDSPSTGDENVSRVWWLAGASIAAIVPAVCLLRRRRRED